MSNTNNLNKHLNIKKNNFKFTCNFIDALQLCSKRLWHSCRLSSSSVCRLSV